MLTEDFVTHVTATPPALRHTPSQTYRKRSPMPRRLASPPPGPAGRWGSFLPTMTCPVLPFAPVSSAVDRNLDRKAKQLDSLNSSATTAAEHRHIVAYYEAKAQDYLAQAHVHEAMLAMHGADPARVSEEQAAMIWQCETFASNFRVLAAKSQEMAEIHHEMSTGAEAR